ncbi:MAG: hypothetical protein Q9184_007429, partial [Pyrenodesmia sp. 2 TL-2023]
MAPGEDGRMFAGLRDKLKGMAEGVSVPRSSAPQVTTTLYDAKVGALHLKNKVGKFGNLVNPNHRHDEEHEKLTDEKRTRIAESHRFNSFAPERDGNKIK